jgi:glycosyltransferase involved in cell wall biosynthesis
MRVLYIYDGPWPKGATRVRKETRVLAAAGHQVDLVVRNAENAPAREDEPWMRVWRLPRIPGRALRYALNFPLFLNPVWLFTIWRILRKTRPELILVCDLPLAPCAVWFGKIFGVPVQYDMAEIYPEFLRSLRQLERQGPLKRLVRTPKLAEWVERPVLRNVACTFVVSDESRDRCIRLGVSPERLVIVGNTPERLPDLAKVDPPPADIADLIRDGREILLFVGIIIADRGVLDAIHAMPALLARRPKATLVVVGDGPERPSLEREVSTLGLGSSVRLVGWRLPEELDAYYRCSDIGLLPFRDSPHIRLTLANKLFDYMGAALPILASDLPSTRRVLLETGAGRLHAPDNALDLARAASEFLEDLPGRQAMGANGRHAAETVYSWARDAERFQDAVLHIR